MDWKEMSNSEIEVKIKELEFEYQAIQAEISKKYESLNILNKEYLNGKYTLEKRMNPSKFN
jgi:hypothetical protein